MKQNQNLAPRERMEFGIFLSRETIPKETGGPWLRLKLGIYFRQQDPQGLLRQACQEVRPQITLF